VTYDDPVPIQKFDSDGNILMEFGTGRDSDGQLIRPGGVAVDASGNVYVSGSVYGDYGEKHHIQKFDSAGNLLTQWGTWGTGDGQFDRPSGITIDSSGNVYVVDSWNHRIQKFRQNGTIVTPGIKGDVNEDGKVGSDDALLALRISAHLVEPSDYQQWAADVNENGEVRADDVILILRIAAGLAAPSVDAVAENNRHITVTLAEAYGVAGKSIKVPIEIDNIDCLGGGDISIGYDPEVLRAVQVSSDSDLLMASNLSDPGTLHIAFANSDGLNGKTLATIEFSIIVDDTSPLTFRKVDLYTPGAIPLLSRGIDQKFISWAIPPDHSELLQNFPNPFNPDTWIPYRLAEGREVTIRIYTASGNLVQQLDLGYKPAGLYVNKDRAAYWNGTNSSGEEVASGLYYYSIQAGDFHAVRKLTVLR
jgi:hypothetical protein